MTPAEIRAAVEARGTTLPHLSRKHGLRGNALSASLTSKERYPKAHRIIAQFLQRPLHELWPHWYGSGDYQSRVGRNRLPSAVFERVLERVANGERRNDVCAEPGQPSITAIHKHRKRDPDFARRWSEALGRRKGAPVSPGEVEAVIARVGAGERLRDVCSDRALPSHAAVLRARRLIPALQTKWISAKTSATARASTARITSRLSSAEVFAVVDAAVRGVPRELRDDLRSDLMLAVLSGEVRPEQAGAAVRRLVTAHNRMFARRDISMDAPIGEDGFTLGSLIADPGSYLPAGVVVRAGR